MYCTDGTKKISTNILPRWGNHEIGVHRFLYVIARKNDEAIANFTGPLCIVCDCHAIARNDIYCF